MAGFQRGNNAFRAAQVVKSGQRFSIRNTHIFSAARVFQPGVFGADAGIIQPGADAVGFNNLPVVILQHVGAVAVQHAGAAALQTGGVLAAVQSAPGGFHAD